MEDQPVTLSMGKVRINSRIALTSWDDVIERYGEPTLAKQSERGARLHWTGEDVDVDAEGVVRVWSARRGWFRVRAECEGIIVERFVENQGIAALLLPHLLVEAFEVQRRLVHVVDRCVMMDRVDRVHTRWAGTMEALAKAGVDQ